MKLYNVPNNTTIRLLEKPTLPPGSYIPDEVLDFYHIDGMYSYCKNRTDGAIIHLAAWTEVEVV